jgi:ribose transport system permease protein
MSSTTPPPSEGQSAQASQPRRLSDRAKDLARPQLLMRQKEQQPSTSTRLGALASRYAVVVVALILIGAFGTTNSHTFFTTSNLQLVLGANSVGLILALGGLLPLIGGEFDLSIGYTLELATVFTAALSEHHVAPGVSLVIVLAMGAVIGLLNSIFITVIGVSSFITTLGVGTVVSAVSLEMTGGNILINGIPQSMTNFAQNNVAGIPKILLPALGCFVVLWIVCERTTYGRRLLAVGLSPGASRLAGVRVGPMLGSSFVLAGMLAALAGWLQLGRVGSASAGVGPDFLLPAIAAGFLGATTIKPGRFNVLGTLVAVALVAIGVNGLQLNGAADWIQPLFDGGVLLLAVGTAQLLSRRIR